MSWSICNNWDKIKKSHGEKTYQFLKSVRLILFFFKVSLHQLSLIQDHQLLHFCQVQLLLFVAYWMSVTTYLEISTLRSTSLVALLSGKKTWRKIGCKAKRHFSLTVRLHQFFIWISDTFPLCVDAGLLQAIFERSFVQKLPIAATG